MSDLLGELSKELETTGPVSAQLDGVQSVMAHEDGKIITGTVQNCQPILDEAKELRDAGQGGSGDFRHLARLPMVAVEIYCNNHGITFAEWQKDPVHARRMVSDPDLSSFRIWDPTRHRSFVGSKAN